MMAMNLAIATANDAPELIRVHTAAFKGDQFSNLMLLRRPEGAHQTRMQAALDTWSEDDTVQVIKAMDGNGFILGWAAWGLREAGDNLDDEGSDKLDSTTSQKEESKSSLENTPESTSKKEEIPSHEDGTPSSTKPATQDPARVLGGIMGAETDKYEDKYLKGNRFLILEALVTDPEYQGRGIGAQLMQWGVGKADAENLPCWAHASPAGYSVYTKAGFEEVGNSEFDLSEWAPGGKGGGRGWGVYVFRYMLRPAKISA